MTRRRVRGLKSGAPGPVTAMPTTMAYIEPENLWALVPDTQVFRRFVSPARSPVLLPGHDGQRASGVQRLVLLRVSLDAQLPTGFARTAVTSLAVLEAEAEEWSQREPPDPVRDALKAFVTSRAGWPRLRDPLVLRVMMLLPSSVVRGGDGFGARVGF